VAHEIIILFKLGGEVRASARRLVDDERKVARRHLERVARRELDAHELVCHGRAVEVPEEEHCRIARAAVDEHLVADAQLAARAPSPSPCCSCRRCGSNSAAARCGRRSSRPKTRWIGASAGVSQP
jgi:hypothetical protein